MPSIVYNATLYRVPGLQYERSLKDGVGIIVTEKRILGRMVYGVHACSCRNIELLELD